MKLYELVTRDWMWTLTIKSEKRRKELRELRISSVSIVEMCDQGGATSLPVLINGKLPRIVLDEAGVTYPFASLRGGYIELLIFRTVTVVAKVEQPQRPL